MESLTITFVPETQDIGIHIITGVITISAIMVTFVMRSIISRPTIIFKMVSELTDIDRYMNFSLKGELSPVYKLFPVLIYNKVYTAKFICLDKPEYTYEQYNLPFDIVKLKTDIERLHIQLEQVNNINETYYTLAIELQDQLQELGELIPNYTEEEKIIEIRRYRSLWKRVRRLDNTINDTISQKCDLLCQLRKFETIYMLYDPFYVRKPSYNWEYE